MRSTQRAAGRRTAACQDAIDARVPLAYIQFMHELSTEPIVREFRSEPRRHHCQIGNGLLRNIFHACVKNNKYFLSALTFKQKITPFF